MQFITPYKFSKLTGLSPSTVRAAIRDRQLPAIRVGKRYRIELTAVNELLRQGMPSRQ